jgi:F-type H+-transporting ATPase subunit gamma
MSLKQVKSKIIATKKTGQVTKAMESVSAVKMRKSQARAFGARPYVESALRILAQLAQSSDGLHHAFMQPGAGERELVILVTSDKGLAGSVNSAVIKQAETKLAATEALDFIAVGRKAAEFVARAGKTPLATYTNISDDVSVEDMESVARSVTEAFATGEHQRVSVIYQNFLSTFEQTPEERTILPLDPAELQLIAAGIAPKTGADADQKRATTELINYTIEPSAEEVLASLVPRLVRIMLFHTLLEHKASEHSARMVAMKNATDKSKEVVKALTIRYNKARQAAITAEVSEITAGVEALK